MQGMNINLRGVFSVRRYRFDSFMSKILSPNILFYQNEGEEEEEDDGINIDGKRITDSFRT